MQSITQAIKLCLEDLGLEVNGETFGKVHTMVRECNPTLSVIQNTQLAYKEERDRRRVVENCLDEVREGIISILNDQTSKTEMIRALERLLYQTSPSDVGAADVHAHEG